VSEAAIGELLRLLDRVRERSRSTWPALVVAHPDDEAHGHEAFADLEAQAAPAAEDDGDDSVIESSPRLRLAPGLPFDAVTDRPSNPGDGDAPILEIIGERPLDDLPEALGVEAAETIDDAPLGVLVAASLALRPRPDAW
jgi:hypothetical protein